MADDQRVICHSDDLQEGGKGVRFEVIWQGQPKSAFVVRHKGKARAYLNQCGHLPVELDWQEGEFFDDGGVYLICATHGALYSPQDGHCVSGRCSGNGLIGLAVEERDNQIRLLEHQLAEK